MRRFPLAAALLLLALAAEAQVPRAVLSELNSATWCGYCPRARAGLDVMLGRYDSIEFDTIDIMASSGGLSCPDSDARIAYYAVSGYPTLEFNGGNTMVGAGTDAIDGGVYDPVVRSLLDDPTPVAMAITDHAFVAGAAHVDVHVALEGDLPAGGSPRLRVALVEDGLSYSGVAYDNVLRGIIADLDLAIAAAGESVDKTFAFTMDPAWNAANLRAVAFVQDDADRAILQACNTRPAPAYGLRYYAAGTTTVVGAGEVVFDAAGLFNTGLNADVYTVSLDTANLPAGGSAHVTGNAGSFSSADVALAPGERALFHVAVDIGAAVQGSVDLVFHAQSGQAADRRITYTVIAQGTPVLVVDDDGAYAYETQYVLPAVVSAGKSAAVWNRGSAKLGADVLAQFDAVVWTCGWAFPTVDADDRAALAAYLDGGGSLFLSGQDIGWEMADEGGAAATWYNTYLHATYLNDDTNDLTLDGVAGTFAEGLAITIGGGDGANNQDYPSEIAPRDAFAQAVFRYTPTRTGGIAVDTGVYKVVYFAFGFEAISTSADRAAVMAGILGFLLPAGQSGVPGAAAQGVALACAPNPFNPQTTVSFDLPHPSAVDVAVYDVGGRRVRRLVAGLQPAGRTAVTWDGRDDGGRSLASGVYLVRLAGDGLEAVRPVTLVK